MSDLSNDLELQIAEIKGENAASATQIATEQKAKEEIMEAKVKNQPIKHAISIKIITIKIINHTFTHTKSSFDFR